MKIRNGFVSNSSSSSFIFGIKRSPKNANELLPLLYPSGKQEVTYFEGSVSTQNAASHIYDGMEKPNKKGLAKFFSERYNLYEVEHYTYRNKFRCCGGIADLNEDSVRMFLDYVSLNNSNPQSGYYMFATNRALAETLFIKKLAARKIEDAFYEKYREVQALFELGWLKLHPVELPSGKLCANKDEIIRELQGAYYDKFGIAYYEAFCASKEKEEIEKLRPEGFHEGLSALFEKCGRTDAEAFLGACKGLKIYTIEIEDHGNAVLEHGDTFSEVPHIRISNH